jgi:hypothetical protein
MTIWLLYILAGLGGLSLVAMGLLGLACYGAAIALRHPRDGENETDR